MWIYQEDNSLSLSESSMFMTWHHLYACNLE